MEVAVASVFTLSCFKVFVNVAALRAEVTLGSKVFPAVLSLFTVLFKC